MGKLRMGRSVKLGVCFGFGLGAAAACTVQGQVAGVASAPVPNASSPATAAAAAPTRAPVVLASGQGYPNGIAADDTRVYWANCKGGDISTVPAFGGSVTKVVSGLHPRHLRVDQANIYWTDSDPT